MISDIKFFDSNFLHVVKSFQLASSGRGGTQFRVSMAETPISKYICGHFICQRSHIIQNLKPGYFAAHDTNSQSIPDIISFELQSESSSSNSSSETSLLSPVNVRSFTNDHDSSKHSPHAHKLKSSRPNKHMSTSVSPTKTNYPFGNTPVPSSSINERSIDATNHDRASPKFSDANMSHLSSESSSASIYSPESSTRASCNLRSFNSNLFTPNACTTELESSTPNDGWPTSVPSSALYVSLFFQSYSPTNIFPPSNDLVTTPESSARI